LKIIAAIHWEALAQGRAAGAAPECRNCERRQYRLGERQTQGLY